MPFVRAKMFPSSSRTNTVGGWNITVCSVVQTVRCPRMDLRLSPLPDMALPKSAAGQQLRDKLQDILRCAETVTLNGFLTPVSPSMHCSQLDYLLPTTRDYRDAMFSTSMPPDVLNAAGRAAMMRSATMWWTAEVSLWAARVTAAVP